MKMLLTSLVAVCLAFFIFPVSASVLYVDLNCTNPTPPYADLTTAAVSIQDAIDAATNGDLILVNDGVYQVGFRVTLETVTAADPPKTISVTNRIVVNKPLTIQSINGPATAFISGGGIFRCVSLTNGATLSGFTLSNGARDRFRKPRSLGIRPMQSTAAVWPVQPPISTDRPWFPTVC